MKTEAEARKCWCPYVDVGGFDVPGEQYDARGFCRNPTFARCIASECMAWRWGPFTDILGKETRDPVTGISEFADPSPTRGYCGLAGQPRP